MARWLANLLLLVAGAIWGMGFVFQKTAMDDMGPLLFIGWRFLLAGLALLIPMLIEIRSKRIQLRKQHWRAFAAVGSVFFVGMGLQQIGLLGTTVTNAGFLTTLYVILVPFLLLIVLRERPAAFVWPATVLAIAGLYCLSDGLQTIQWGDWFVLAGAAVWAVHVILVGRFAKLFSMPVTMTCIQFFVAASLGFSSHAIGVTAGYGQLGFDWQVLQGAWKEIVYAGVFSGGLAFTLQAVGQQHTTPSIAAILMASESLFAALFSAWMLGEQLSYIGYVGCGLIFASILIVEVMQNWMPTSRKPAEPSKAAM